MPPGNGILNIDERREGERREETNGSITWKGIRMPALLAMLLTVGGGATYIKAKEPDDTKARILVLENDREYIRMELADMKRSQVEMNAKLDTLIRSDSYRSGREAARRRTEEAK